MFEKSATSEMVTEEVRRAKQLRDLHPEHKPVILPIRVNFPMSLPLNYDLRGYLQRIQQREWRSPADTPTILKEVLSLLAPELAAAIKKVVATTSPVRLESMQAFKLHSMGLVHLQGNDCSPRCDLYRQYFRERLRVS